MPKKSRIFQVHPAQVPPAQVPPSLSISQVLGLLIELRDLACRLISLHAQQTYLLEEDLQLLTLEQTAELLACEPPIVRRRIREGELEAVRGHGLIRVTRVSVRAYIERNKIAGEGTDDQ